MGETYKYYHEKVEKQNVAGATMEYYSALSRRKLVIHTNSVDESRKHYLEGKIQSIKTCDSICGNWNHSCHDWQGTG